MFGWSHRKRSTIQFSTQPKNSSQAFFIIRLAKNRDNEMYCERLSNFQPTKDFLNSLGLQQRNLETRLKLQLMV